MAPFHCGIAYLTMEVSRGGGHCAICFEALGGSAVELPCSCAAVYCLRCWDHALAVSFRSCGVARCPTCRTAVRVDLEPGDSPQCVMRFSREARDPDTIFRDYEHQRLAEQAKPVQVKLLHSFGERIGGDGPTDAALLDKGPPCVCGNWLKGVKLSTRLMQRTEQAYSIICDLCEHTIRSGSTWTCQNGYGTVVHPASYDVCDMCLARYVGGNLDPEEESEESEESDGDLPLSHTPAAFHGESSVADGDDARPRQGGWWSSIFTGGSSNRNRRVQALRLSSTLVTGALVVVALVRMLAGRSAQQRARTHQGL